MSLMTPEERSSLVPKGLYVKTKCDSCGLPIMSALTFTGPNGEDFCSRVCLGRGTNDKKSNKEHTVKAADKKPAPSKNKADAGPEKNKKRATAEVEEAPKKKKKVAVEEEDDAPPAKKSKKVAAPEPVKKKKKAVAEEEDEAPAKKSKKAATAPVAAAPGTNPYSRPGAVVYDAFEMAKKGTTVKALNAFLEERGVAPARVWRELRSKEFKGTKWRYTETEDGKVQVKIRTAKSEE